MSLSVFQNRPAGLYMRTAFGLASGDVAKAFSIQNSVTGLHQTATYCDKIQVWRSWYNVHGAASAPGHIDWDPFLSDTSSSKIQYHPTPTTGGNYFLHVSAYVPATGAQEMFLIDETSNQPFRLVQYSSPEIIDVADPFPEIRGDNPPNLPYSLSTNDGYWNNVGNRSSPIMFLGWPGPPEISAGNDVGTMWWPSCTVRWDGVTYVATSIYVNMKTGEGIPVGVVTGGQPDHMIALYKTTPSHQFQGNKLFNQIGIEFHQNQWIPDDDSSALKPKGQIFTSVQVRTSPPVPALQAGTFTIRFTDFNPEGGVGTPIRTHMRERVLTQCQWVASQSAPGDPNWASETNQQNTQTFSNIPSLFYCPLTGRPTILGGAGFGDADDFDTAPFYSQLTEYAPVPSIDQLTAPEPRQGMSTNRITVVGVEAVGDIGEPVAGVSIDWTLEAVSTRDEVLTIVGPSGSNETVQLANAPIDHANLSYKFELRKDVTTILEEGVDFTVDDALGQITFLAAEPFTGSIYNIDYTHPNVPVSPAFGSLLVKQSLTNTAGEATTRVRQPDTPANAGFLDRITAATP